MDEQLSCSRDFALTQFTVQKSKYLTNTTVSTEPVLSMSFNVSRLDRINQNYYNIWFGDCIAIEENVPIKVSNLVFKQLKSRNYCRSRFNISKTFLYFSEKTLRKKTDFELVFAENVFELLSTEAFEAEVNSKNGYYLFYFCSVLTEKDICMKLFSKTHDKCISWKQFNIIMENWGWQSDPDEKEQAEDDIIVGRNAFLAEHNIFCILQFVKNSLEHYSCDELHCLVNILSNLCIDSLCIGLGTTFSQLLEAAICRLIKTFNISHHDIVEQLKIKSIPMSCVLTICSKVATKISLYPIAFVLALTSVCEWFGFVYSFKSKVSVQTVLKILLVIGERFANTDIKDVCSCLALIGFVLARLHVKFDQVQKIKEITLCLSNMKVYFNSNMNFAVFCESANRIFAICWSKLQPFRTFESRYAIGFC